jgi:uncharacterized protein
LLTSRASPKKRSSATGWRPCARCGRRALRVVVDTNAWVSGLILPGSVPGRVLQAVRGGRLTAGASWELADVLRRPRLRRYSSSEEDIQSALLLLAPLLPEVDLDVEARGPTDGPVVAAAVVGRAEAIVTGDRHLLDDEDLRLWLRKRGIEVVTPAELVDTRRLA